MMNTDLYIKLQHLHDWLEQAVTKEVEEVGGRVTNFSVEDRILEIDVDDSLKEYISGIIVKLYKEYARRRMEVFGLGEFKEVVDVLDQDLVNIEDN